jgi:hypothetical protein
MGVIDIFSRELEIGIHTLSMMMPFTKRKIDLYIG